MRSTFLSRADPWLLFIPPTLPSADPWDESQSKLLMFLKKHPVLSHLQGFYHTSTRFTLSTISHIIYLLMPYSFPKSQLCGLHCECFPKPPAKYSSPTLISPYWNFLYHFLYYGMYSQLRFFLVFIIPRNLLQQDLHNRLSWNVNEWMNVSLSTLWIQMTFKNYFRTFWWDLEAERPGIIIIEGT